MTFTDINANLTSVYYGSVAAGDYDGDNDLDLLITGWDDNGNRISKIYDNDGTGGFTENTDANLPGVYRSSVAWGDYDGDSDLDLLVTGRDNDRNHIAKIYKNDGSGGLSEDTNNLIGVRDSSVAWGDYDGDSDLDLLVTGNEGSGNATARIYKNDGSGGLSEETNNNLTGVFNSYVAVGDYDGDSDLDLLITGNTDYSSNRVAIIYSNDGSGNFSENTDANLTGSNHRAVAAGDYDGDNDLDFLITQYDSTINSYVTQIYKNDGSGGFSEDTNNNLVGIFDSTVSWVDYDGDGNLDVLLAGGENAKVYINDGSGGFSEDTNIDLLGVRDGSVAIGDYDGDTDLDILLTGYYEDYYNYNYSPVAKIYRNDNPIPVNNSGRDTLEGTATDETLDGGEGNDILGGSLGADSLIGGNGLDRVIYRNSTAAVTVDLLNNIASGGDADGDTFDSIEYLDGSNFGDSLVGDGNNNRIYGGNGDDTLVGNDGDDYLSGQNGADSIEGGAGFDRLVGGNGADSLMGDGDNDILAGGKGADSITGADTTTNGIGERDRLMGGAGADVFVLGTDTTAFYDDGDNATDGIADYALISDFDANEDAIELSSSATYYLDVNPVGTSSGTGIFIDSDSSGGYNFGDELVGLIADASLTAGLVDNSTTGFSLV